MNNNFYSKDERQFIDFLNKNLGTQHRNKPYDFNNKEDLKDLMILLVGKYMDFRKYWSKCDDLYGELDESIELYTPLTWAAMTNSDISGDKIILQTISALGVVESNLSDLYMQTEAELKELIGIIMKKSDEIQNHIWNGIYHFDEKAFENLFNKVGEAEYTYSIDESFKLFCSLMNNVKNEMIEMESTKNDHPIMLHLELINEWCDEENLQMLMNYADTTEKGTITRDILIPADMPLHNLHYAIQRLFGWQNSHLRAFRLDAEDYKRLTGNRVKEWSDLTGILFSGVPDDENDRFWDEDYMDGNFKTWLKKKYSGPYEYGGYTENYDVARASVDGLIRRFPEIEVRESFHVYYERNKGKKQHEKEPIRILRRAPILDLTMDELKNTINFESGLDELLEKIEVRHVLGSKGEQLAEFDEIINGVNGDLVRPVTDKLIYSYDFGDNWIVEITKIDNYDNLNDSVENSDLDQAISIVKEKYKPVCIHKKGGFVMDDVGGMSGYTDFIHTIYKSDDAEEKKSIRQWAKGAGWNNRKIEPQNML